MKKKVRGREKERSRGRVLQERCFAGAKVEEIFQKGFFQPSSIDRAE